MQLRLTKVNRVWPGSASDVWFVNKLSLSSFLWIGQSIAWINLNKLTSFHSESYCSYTACWMNRTTRQLRVYYWFSIFRLLHWTPAHHFIQSYSTVFYKMNSSHSIFWLDELHLKLFWNTALKYICINVKCFMWTVNSLHYAT